MRQNITHSENKNPGDMESNSSSRQAHAEDDFVELDLRVERIEFSVTGEIINERFDELELAKAKLQKTPCPSSVQIDNVPDLGIVDLCYHRHALLGLAVAGMRAELVQANGSSLLTIQGGGPHILERSIWLSWRTRPVGSRSTSSAKRLILSFGAVQSHCTVTIRIT